jgi:hypothetical protein
MTSADTLLLGRAGSPTPLQTVTVASVAELAALLAGGGVILPITVPRGTVIWRDASDPTGTFLQLRSDGAVVQFVAGVERYAYERS